MFTNNLMQRDEISETKTRWNRFETEIQVTHRRDELSRFLFSSNLSNETLPGKMNLRQVSFKF